MKRVARLISLLAGIQMIFLLFAFAGEARLAATNRRAVVLEAFFALRPSYDGGCDKTIKGNCVSSWNYLYNDLHGYSVVKGWYSCDSSVWAVAGDIGGCANYGPISFYSNVASYSFGTFGGLYGPVGRGGQCKYFANLLLYRSASDQRLIPSYNRLNATEPVETNMTKIVEGDVIFTYNRGAVSNHVAIVVQVKRDIYGNVSSADVVDSNYISDTGGYNREVIGRHNFTISTLNQYYRIWKGVSYYYEPYTP